MFSPTLSPLFVCPVPLSCTVVVLSQKGVHMLTYKLDPDTLTPLQLSQLTAQLSRLATDVSYNQSIAQLTIDGYGNGQRAIEDLVMPYLPIVNEAPNMMKLAALSKKRQRQAA